MVARGVRFLDHRRIGHGLAEEFGGDVRAAAQQQTHAAGREGVSVLDDGVFAAASVADFQLGTGRKPAREGWLVHVSNPGGKDRHVTNSVGLNGPDWRRVLIFPEKYLPDRRFEH